MPIYEYQCQTCGTLTEELESYDAPKTRTCDCSKDATMTRTLAAPGFVLKGGCWGKDGYTSSDISTPSPLDVRINPPGWISPQIDRRTMQPKQS